jgi:precorrin-2/cobalt-factor-2 C20-methyltransferase
MSPERAVRQKARHEAEIKVLSVLQGGEDVVFITEGDPLLYSTFQHLLAEIPPEIGVEVCSGISAMFSAAASACFPLAIEGQLLITAPAEAAAGDIQEWLSKGYNLVLFKVSHRLKEIVAEVQKTGLECEAVLVERASTNEEIITRDLSQWAEREVPYFSIVLIHLSETQRRST